MIRRLGRVIPRALCMPLNYFLCRCNLQRVRIGPMLMLYIGIWVRMLHHHQNVGHVGQCWSNGDRFVVAEGRACRG